MKTIKWSLTILAGLFSLNTLAQPSIQTLVEGVLSEPYAVTVDADNNYYVADSANNRIMRYSTSSGAVSLIAGNGSPGLVNDALGVRSSFFNPQGIAYVPDLDALAVADSGNNVIRLVQLSGATTTLTGTGAAESADGAPDAASFNFPVGLAAGPSGLVFVADMSNHSIRVIDTAGGNTTSTIISSGLLRPTAVSVNEDASKVYVADTGNHAIRVYDFDGTTATLDRTFGSGDRFVFGDTSDQASLDAEAALFNGPRGVVYRGGEDRDIIFSDTGNGKIKRIYFNTLIQDYSVKEFIQQTEENFLVSPHGIAIDNNGNFPVADLGKNTLESVQLTSPQEPIEAPEIGSVGEVKDRFGEFLLFLDHEPTGTFNDDRIIAIEPAEDNIQTYYTFISNSDFEDSPEEWLNAPFFRDGALVNFAESIVTPNIISEFGPVINIKALSTAAGRISSPEATATYTYEVGSINFLDESGEKIPPRANFTDPQRKFQINPISIIMTNSTSNARIYYTLDGSPPWQVDPVTERKVPAANATFYTPDSQLNLVEEVFTSPDPENTGILFRAMAFRNGFDPTPSHVEQRILSGDLVASEIGFTEDFSAGIGSTIVVPVTINLQAGQQLQSLQFRVEVAPNDGAPEISTQFRHVPHGPNDFIPIPQLATNTPISQVYKNTDGSTGILFAYINHQGGLNVSGDVSDDPSIVALFAVPIPSSAQEGQTYTLRILEPSGTSDAIQTPVFITTRPDRTITVQNISYFVGDSAQARWYNAGDFGNRNLNNNDVNSAFKASVGIIVPFNFTDAFDAMDAFPEDTVPAAAGGTASAGGDGQIRFLDWQVILNRSLRLGNLPDPGDPDLSFRRRWNTGGFRVSLMDTLIGIPNSPSTELPREDNTVWKKEALIKAGTVSNAQAGTAVSVPVSIVVDEGLQLAGLQFRAEVIPSIGAPSLTSPVTFAPEPNVPLGDPRTLQGLEVAGMPINSAASAWSISLDSGAIITGEQLLGLIQFSVPASAASGHSYRVRFVIADGSPDFSTQYEFESISGTVWVNSNALQPQSILPDEWAREFFGALTPALLDATADADGDGENNWEEYLNGTNPTELRFHDTMGDWRADNEGNRTLKFYGRSGRTYRVDKSDNLNDWESLTSNMPGSDNVIEIQDDGSSDSSMTFYRILAQ